MLVKVMQGQYSIATAPQTRPIVVDSEYTAYLITLMASDAITATIKPSTRYITFLLAMVPRAHKLGRYSNTQRGSCDSDDQPTEGVVPKQWYGEASTVLSNTPRLIDSGCHEAVSSHFFWYLCTGYNCKAQACGTIAQRQRSWWCGSRVAIL